MRMELNTFLLNDSFVTIISAWYRMSSVGFKCDVLPPMLLNFWLSSIWKSSDFRRYTLANFQMWDVTSCRLWHNVQLCIVAMPIDFRVRYNSESDYGGFRRTSEQKSAVSVKVVPLGFCVLPWIPSHCCYTENCMLYFCFDDM